MSQTVEDAAALAALAVSLDGTSSQNSSGGVAYEHNELLAYASCRTNRC